MKPMEVGIMFGFGIHYDPFENLQKVNRIGVKSVQMWRPPDEYLAGQPYTKLKEAIMAAQLVITGMFLGFDGEDYSNIATVRQTVGFLNPTTRGERLSKAMQVCDYAKSIGVSNMVSHVGFIPEDHAQPDYAEMVSTIRTLAQHCKSNGQTLSLETGQETPQNLLDFIADVNEDNLKVNFDPANILLYGIGDPLGALKQLFPYVIGVHCKDGKMPTVEGELGTEMPLGEGDVGFADFIGLLKSLGYQGPLTIEREIGGEEQIADLLTAKAYVEDLVANK